MPDLQGRRGHHLQRPAGRRRLKRLNVLVVKGDVSTADLPANDMLRNYGKDVPRTVIFPPTGRPVVIGGWYADKPASGRTKED